MSTQGPVELKPARVSVIVVAPTARVAVRPRGSRSQEFAPVLPAEVARKTPESIIAVSAAASVSLQPKFHEVFATAGRCAFAVTKSTAAIAPDRLPAPAQLSQRTACRRTFLATPYVSDPIVPATCVPWPLQSTFGPPNALKSAVARPSKSGG